MITRSLAALLALLVAAGPAQAQFAAELGAATRAPGRVIAGRAPLRISAGRASMAPTAPLAARGPRSLAPAPTRMPGIERTAPLAVSDASRGATAQIARAAALAATLRTPVTALAAKPLNRVRALARAVTAKPDQAEAALARGFDLTKMVGSFAEPVALAADAPEPGDSRPRKRGLTRPFETVRQESAVGVGANLVTGGYALTLGAAVTKGLPLLLASHGLAISGGYAALAGVVTASAALIRVVVRRRGLAAKIVETRAQNRALPAEILSRVGLGALLGTLVAPAVTLIAVTVIACFSVGLSRNGNADRSAHAAAASLFGALMVGGSIPVIAGVVAPSLIFAGTALVTTAALFFHSVRQAQLSPKAAVVGAELKPSFGDVKAGPLGRLNLPDLAIGALASWFAALIGAVSVVARAYGAEGARGPAVDRRNAVSLRSFAFGSIVFTAAAISLHGLALGALAMPALLFALSAWARERVEHPSAQRPGMPPRRAFAVMGGVAAAYIVAAMREAGIGLQVLVLLANVLISPFSFAPISSIAGLLAMGAAGAYALATPGGRWSSGGRRRILLGLVAAGWMTAAARIGGSGLEALLAPMLLPFLLLSGISPLLAAPALSAIGLLSVGAAIGVAVRHAQRAAPRG